MIQHEYGTFSDNQFEEYKTKLHSELFWLIIYKDPKYQDQYKNINVDKYISFLMKKLDGLNALLSYPKELVEILSMLKATQIELKKEPFDWASYRKLVLDTHKHIDTLCVKEENDD